VLLTILCLLTRRISSLPTWYSAGTCRRMPNCSAPAHERSAALERWVRTSLPGGGSFTALARLGLVASRG